MGREQQHDGRGGTVGGLLFNGEYTATAEYEDESGTTLTGSADFAIDGGDVQFEIVLGEDSTGDTGDEYDGSGDQFTGASGPTNANGIFNFEAPDGDYRVSVDHPDGDGVTEGEVTVSGSGLDIQVELGGEVTAAPRASEDGGSYPWSGRVRANPYTDQNNYSVVGIQPASDRPQADDADVTVSSVPDLVSAIDAAGEGETIWLANGTYDISDENRRWDLPANATLAADGALLIQDSDKSGVFELTNDGARLSGLRIQGPHTGFYTGSDTATGIFARADVTTDNCEVFGFNSSGLFVGWNDDAPPSQIEPTIRNYIIRDNKGNGLGYGIVVYSGNPLIEHNFINNNRHGVASGGGAAASYRAYSNLHGEDGLIFQFEMHAPGGNTVDIRNNEFLMVENDNGNPARAYAQRGTPSNVAEVRSNWIHNPNEPGSQPDAGSDAAIVQYNHGSSEWVNVEFSNNHYGNEEPPGDGVGVRE